MSAAMNHTLIDNDFRYLNPFHSFPYFRFYIHRLLQRDPGHYSLYIQLDGMVILIPVYCTYMQIPSNTRESRMDPFSSFP
ncbi:hypothetical protein I7I50_07464 [Histoplasma capsulatum G186AR]|uniref:Uncharacterized protein n=1 Tax=Ajellomyces capsulatus TaxID=5037 RepID=A0A8H8D375_AJECA|nr:hypothetical protein I7I52_09464 [Histoplasma capsulatum]QSS68158.1 hypothetical protein I7I50_07464 [Histoplasma capsulatum G186AR]